MPVYLPAALEAQKRGLSRYGHEPKWNLRNIGHLISLAQSASMSNAGAAAIISCYGNNLPDNDSQAIDAVSGLYRSGSAPKWRYHILLILVEVEFVQVLYSCIIWKEGCHLTTLEDPLLLLDLIQLHWINWTWSTRKTRIPTRNLRSSHQFVCIPAFQVCVCMIESWAKR